RCPRDGRVAEDRGTHRAVQLSRGRGPGAHGGRRYGLRAAEVDAAPCAGTGHPARPAPLLGRAPHAGRVRGSAGARMGAPASAAQVYRGIVRGLRGRSRASSRRLGARGGARGLSGAGALRGVRRRPARDDRSDAHTLPAARIVHGAPVLRLIRLRTGCQAAACGVVDLIGDPVERQDGRAACYSFKHEGGVTVIHAAITGWGKCLPPAVLSNHDLSGLLDTSDEWIVSRTGIRERRISHVGLEELAYVAAARALAAAAISGSSIELIVFGTCSHEDQVPNMASGIQVRIGAPAAAAFDINTACTSFLYGLSAATALIRTQVVRNALVIGAELISPFMDWRDRDVAVLFGDGAAAVVLEASDREEGVLAEKLGCYGDARETLRVQGMGGRYANRGVLYGITRWQFEGQEIFK